MDELLEPAHVGVALAGCPPAGGAANESETASPGRSKTASGQRALVGPHRAQEALHRSQRVPVGRLPVVVEQRLRDDLEAHAGQCGPAEQVAAPDGGRSVELEAAEALEGVPADQSAADAEAVVVQAHSRRAAERDVAPP